MSDLVEPIQTIEGLQPLIEAIRSEEEVYIDTEADSLHHYFEKVCLIQFTVKESHYLVDPLQKLDLKPMLEALKEKLLVFHGADYDLRMLKMSFDFVPSRIFDTMLGARLAGHKALGLDALVEKYAGKKLDPSAQKADWSQRPLPPNLLAYAVDDTRYLPLISSHLRAELSGLGRHTWHEQQCTQLIQNCSRTIEKADPWRIKGSFALDRESLAILKEVWTWRDAEAQSWDRPSYMVLHNEKLIELSQWAKKNRGEDAQKGLGQRRWPSRLWKNLQQALERAWNLPPENWPEQTPRGKRPAYQPEFPVRLQKLKEVRDAKAKELNLEPSIIATTATLEFLAGNPPRNLEAFSSLEKWLPWQTELLGESFVNACQNTS